MPMSDGRIGRLGDVLRAAFAVLAAILIAFALDAWWDGRVERAEMREALDIVASELDANIGLIDAAVADNARAAEATARAVSLDPSGLEALAPAELAELSGVMDYSIVQFRLGATTAFIEGGHLNVLEDKVLRADIAGLARIQLEIDEEAAGVDDISADLARELLFAFPIESVTRAAGPEPASEYAGREMLRVIATEEIVQRLLVARAFTLTDIYGAELELVRDDLVRVRAAISRELRSD